MNQDPNSDRSRIQTTRLILVDGLLKKGGLFATWMLLVGYLSELYFDGVGIVDYLTSGKTWRNFLFYFFFFGLFTGMDKWFSQKGKKVERYEVT